MAGQGGVPASGVRSERLHVSIAGVVQGVGYRAFVAREAWALGVAGWVCNQTDGSVEVLAVAAPEVLAQFEGALRRGPPGARVEAVRPLTRVRAHAPGGGFAVVRCCPPYGA